MRAVIVIIVAVMAIAVSSMEYGGGSSEPPVSSSEYGGGPCIQLAVHSVTETCNTEAMPPLAARISFCNGDGIPHQHITISIGHGRDCDATTDSNGVAQCTISCPPPLESRTIVAEFEGGVGLIDGEAGLLPRAEGEGEYTVEPDATSAAVSYDNKYGFSVKLHCTLTPPLPMADVVFSIGDSTASAITDPTGVAHLSVVVPGPGTDVSCSYAGTSCTGGAQSDSVEVIGVLA